MARRVPIVRRRQKRKSPTTELNNKAHQLAWKAEYVTNQEINVTIISIIKQTVAVCARLTTSVTCARHVGSALARTFHQANEASQRPGPSVVANQ